MSKKMMNKEAVLKKISVFCLTGIMILGLMACGQKSGKTVSSDNKPTASETKKDTKAGNIGKFETSDLEKNKVTQDVFKENNLTMVNLFSSTCNPCMEELPHLAELANEYEGKKVGVLGINIDIDSKGAPDEDSRKAVSKVLSKTKSKMKVIFWDENLMNTLLQRTDALPYTFFVDKEGNVVGEEYLGDKSKEEWAKVIDKELKNISGK